MTDIARSMVTRYGMSEKLGHIAYEQEPRTFLGGNDLPVPPRERDYAEQTAAVVDAEVRGIVDTAFKRTLTLLEQRRPLLELTARQLLAKETLDERELMKLVSDQQAAA